MPQTIKNPGIDDELILVNRNYGGNTHRIHFVWGL